MAISKIMNMKDSGNAYHGKHLKRSIDYITEGWKTQEGQLVGVLNCLPGNVYEQMRDTKQLFDKNSGRQGYHLVLSFKQGEVNPDTAFDIAGKFAVRYLGARYETVYSVHDNTDCIHAHIIWNSVSFVDGRKFHYKKGDWERDIYPIVNELCREYGLSELKLDDEKVLKSDFEERNRNAGQTSWNPMIKRDLDACILQAATFAEFQSLLMEKWYECKEGKHFAVKPPGMGRFRRCSSLGEDYSEEQIRKRIELENIKSYAIEEKKPAQIVRCRIKRYRRAKLSGLQKKYYARLYRIGVLKKHPYSQAWKYRDEIQKLEKIQRQYLFLDRYDIHTMEELAAVISSLQEKDSQAISEKKKVYRERQRFKDLFEIAECMGKLQNAHTAYVNGDAFFEEEEKQWNLYVEQIKCAGYNLEEVQLLREHIRQRIAEVIEKESAVKRELATGNSIFYENIPESSEKLPQEKEERNRNKDRTQPIR